jgi:hypothetical protein
MQTQTAPYDPHREYNARIAAEMEQFFGTESRALERAVATFQTGKQALLRPDGQPRYAEAEMREREAALLAAFDQEAGWVRAQADEAIPAAQAELAKLAGADPFDSLKPAEQERASLRREFIREDAELLRPDQLVTQARGALAANDRPLLYLMDRYVGMRIDRDGARRDPALVAVHREMAERFKDPKLGEKREKLERKIDMAKLLNGRIGIARRELDGSWDAMLNNMRRQIRL